MFNLVFDLAALLLITLLAAAFFINRPKNVTDVGVFHSFYQKAVGLCVILWGVAVTLVAPGETLGYTTLVISLFITCGLMLIEFRYLAVFSIVGIGILYLAALLTPSDELSFREMSVVVGGFVVAIVINTLNRNAMTKSFLLEQDLERKVEERTRQLALETENATKSDRLKTVFLANMSHEIRTPLNGILGFTDLLKDEDLTQSQRNEYLDIVKKSGHNLLEILNGIIEVSRIESGVCDIYNEKFLLNDLFIEVISFCRGYEKVSSGSIVLVNEAEERPAFFVNTDRVKLIQIMVNLISNAIKYTDAGTVTVGFESVDDKLMIFVKDTGKGIEKEDLELIFNRFQQVNLEPYTQRDGVGLGLTIVKGYTDILGGTVGVSSKPGAGSEFRLMLPIGLI